MNLFTRKKQLWHKEVKSALKEVLEELRIIDSLCHVYIKGFLTKTTVKLYFNKNNVNLETFIENSLKTKLNLLNITVKVEFYNPLL